MLCRDIISDMQLPLEANRYPGIGDRDEKGNKGEAKNPQTGRRRGSRRKIVEKNQGKGHYCSRDAFYILRESRNVQWRL